MTTVTFDTHALIKRLVKKGMKEPLAEEVAQGLKESREFDLSQLVTKDYLDSRINQLKFELIKWILGTAIVGFSGMTSIIIAVLKFYLKKGVGA